MHQIKIQKISHRVSCPSFPGAARLPRVPSLQLSNAPTESAHGFNVGCSDSQPCVSISVQRRIRCASMTWEGPVPSEAAEAFALTTVVAIVRSAVDHRASRTVILRQWLQLLLPKPRATKRSSESSNVTRVERRSKATMPVEQRLVLFESFHRYIPQHQVLTFAYIILLMNHLLCYGSYTMYIILEANNLLVL